jgi:hypothetical protein
MAILCGLAMELHQQTRNRNRNLLFNLLEEEELVLKNIE